MRHLFAIAGVSALFALGGFAEPGSAPPPPKTAHVQVHCPTGNAAGFVTPDSLHIAVDDSVRWGMTGQVTSDSLIITLKNPRQAWPFTGHAPRGGTSATAARALHTGRYGYSVTLECRLPHGGTQRVVIDPDIIIQ